MNDKQELLRVVKFLSSGVMAAFVEFALFIILAPLLKVPVFIAAALSFCGGLLVSYILNSRFVFKNKRDSKRKRQQILLFALLATMNLGISAVGTSVLDLALPAVVAKLCLMAAIATSNYFIFKHIIFNDKRPLITRQSLLARLRRPEWIYATIAFFAGLVFVFIIPPGWSPDEPQHYWRVQQLVDGQLVASDLDSKNPGQSVGGELNTNAANFILSFGGYRALDDPSYRLPFPAWESSDALTTQTDSQSRTTLQFSGSAIYNPVVYAPQIAGVATARSLGLSLYSGFLLAKIFGLVLQVAAIFWAIRLIPKGKWILLTIGLLPATLVQSAAFGADIMTTSTAFLFIAYVLGLSFSGKSISTLSSLVISGLLVVLGFVKPVYLVLASLLLLIPLLNPASRTLRQYIKVFGPVIIAAVLSVSWVLMIQFIKANGNPEANISAQKDFLLSNPLQLFSILFNTYFTDAQPRLYSTLMGNFLWETAKLPTIFQYLSVVMLVLSCFAVDTREQLLKVSTKAKLLFNGINWGAFLLTLTAISGALYAYFTAPGASSIKGIQGRYFIPALPLLLLPFSGNPLQKQRTVKFTILAVVGVLIIASIVTILYRVHLPPF